MGEYQKAKNEGRIGSRKDATWSKELHAHICCKSKHSWYHKPNCEALKGNFFIPEVRSSKKDKINKLRESGMNSLEVSIVLGISLAEINRLWE